MAMEMWTGFVRRGAGHPEQLVSDRGSYVEACDQVYEAALALHGLPVLFPPPEMPILGDIRNNRSKTPQTWVLFGYGFEFGVRLTT